MRPSAISASGQRAALGTERSVWRSAVTGQRAEPIRPSETRPGAVADSNADPQAKSRAAGHAARPRASAPAEPLRIPGGQAGRFGKSISVALVDRDARFLARMRVALETADDLRCVATCRSAEEALATLPALGPNVILMAVGLPVTSGVECVRWLRPAMPDAEFVMLSDSQSNGELLAAFMAGAIGYLLKPVRPVELLAALRDAWAGGAPMSPLIARQVVLAARELPEAGAESDRLTSRQHQVLTELAVGHSYKDIARLLTLDFDTVRTHVRNIYRKLHVHTRAEAVRRFGAGAGVANRRQRLPLGNHPDSGSHRVIAMI